MAAGRIPGPLGTTQASGRPVAVPRPLTLASPQRKQMPVGVTASPQAATTPAAGAEIIFYPPPRLAQGYIYKKPKERLYGCWATAAEMIVKWRNESAKFQRPDFEDRVETGDDPKRKVAFRDFQHQCLLGWGFQLIKGAALTVYLVPEPRKPEDITFDKWTTPLLAEKLNAYGPLYCVGTFWANAEHNLAVGGDQHAIAVFGAQWDVVYYRDPWDGDIKKMTIGAFDKNLLRSSLQNIYRFGPHQSWKVGI